MKYSDRPNAYINAKDLEIAVVKATTYGDALKAVREQPSIDIEPKRGEWLWDDGHFCSECREYAEYNAVIEKEVLSNFCPNCGAKMK